MCALNKQELSAWFEGNIAGAHLCSIYQTKEEKLSVVIPCILSGLTRGERCVYIFEEGNPEEICSLLNTRGVETDIHIKSGQLIFLPAGETYLKDAFFSPFRMLDFFKESHYETLKSGFNGLRAAGEMSWSLGNAPGSGRLTEYESEVNNIFGEMRLAGLCQYDETKFPEEILTNVIYTHSKVIFYGILYDNPFYISPKWFRHSDYIPGTYQKLKEQIINIL
jgi:hypothetical protein